MRRLADLALVGLERAGSALPDVDVGADLVSRLPAPSSESAFLLRLGVAAVRARAGRRPAQAQPGTAAPPEVRPACSDALAAIVTALCRERSFPLLAEALVRLDARGGRVPPSCLVDLAGCRHPALQPAAGRVAGARGRWLAAHNPAWAWLVEAEAPPAPAERRQTWEEGSLPARLAALRAIRTEAPAEGRAWVESVWRQEKAAVREELLNALAVGLAAEDEPFLIGALADRAAPVRAAAASVLAGLPSSALAARMQARVAALLRYRPRPAGAPVLPGAVGADSGHLEGQPPSGTLEVSPPAVFPPDWATDGLLEKPPARVGAKAFWVAQLLAVVPPEQVSDHFGASPGALVAAARASDWAGALLGGWLEAALRFRSAPWASALWRGHAAAAPEEERPALAVRLLPLLPPGEASALAAHLLASGDPVRFLPVMAALPAPWEVTFADAFLTALARALESGPGGWPQVQAWRAGLERAGIALPGAGLDRALALVRGAASVVSAAPLAGALLGLLPPFHAVLATRKRIHEETRP